MSTTFSLLFYLKKPKAYISGPIPIYLRITVNSQRAEVSSGRDCLSERWNASAGRAFGNKEEAKALNVYLDTIQAKVYEAHRQLLNASALITAETLRNKYSGKGEKPLSLVDIFKNHNKQIEALVGQEYAIGTLQRYETSLKHVQDFLTWKFSISDIDIRQIDHAFITEFEFYLRSVRKCNNNSAVKYIKNFGKIIRICLANGWLEKNPFVNYKAKVKEVERAFLTEDEIQIISDKVFITERLNQVRDIFLFSCYTGLAYADVKKLDNAQIVTGIDGEKWIHTHRQKTDTRSNIPLLPTAMAIIRKYKDHPQCLNSDRVLPVLSNQKVNSYLKEIADCCGIEKELTFHIARHTFATSVTLTNGVSIESVSKMLGHKNLRTTQHYAKILDQKVSEDMKLLKERIAESRANRNAKNTG
jgi:site-specific recombinase XerD